MPALAGGVVSTVFSAKQKLSLQCFFSCFSFLFFSLSIRGDVQRGKGGEVDDYSGDSHLHPDTAISLHRWRIGGKWNFFDVGTRMSLSSQRITTVSNYKFRNGVVVRRDGDGSERDGGKGRREVMTAMEMMMRGGDTGVVLHRSRETSRANNMFALPRERSTHLLPYSAQCEHHLMSKNKMNHGTRTTSMPVGSSRSLSTPHLHYPHHCPSTLADVWRLPERYSRMLSSSSCCRRYFSSGTTTIPPPCTTTGGGGRGRGGAVAAPESFPKTKLPFLQHVVQRVRKLPPLPTPPLFPPHLRSSLSSSLPMKKKARAEMEGRGGVGGKETMMMEHPAGTASLLEVEKMYMKASAFAPYPLSFQQEKMGLQGRHSLSKNSSYPGNAPDSSSSTLNKNEKGTSKNTSCVLYRDESCVLVNDAYPKSYVHALILPLDPSLQSLNDLVGPGKPFSDAAASPSLHIPISYDGGFCSSSSTSTSNSSSTATPVASRWVSRPQNHVQLLEHMCCVGDAYAQFLQRTEPEKYVNRRFITGFHALPSLAPLHLHLISMDLESPCLKTKKHYNSFSTYFFLTTDRIIDDLRKNQRITINQDTKTLARYESQGMECLWCGLKLKDIPTMKKHVPACPLNKAYLTPSSSLPTNAGGASL